VGWLKFKIQNSKFKIQKGGEGADVVGAPATSAFGMKNAQWDTPNVFGGRGAATSPKNVDFVCLAIVSWVIARFLMIYLNCR
jgi:hypothetical protein